MIARVLSINPFIVEIIDDGIAYKPRPVFRNIKHVPEETSQLRYGDIISAEVYSYTYGAEELGLGTGFRNIRKLGERAKSKYDRTGFLFHYLRVTNSPNSYLTIYRDGTVLCQDTPGNYITNRALSPHELNKLLSQFRAAGIEHLPSETNLKDVDPALISSVGKYQQLTLTNPSPGLKRFLSRLDALLERYIDSATYRVSYYRRFLIKDWSYEKILALDEITDTFGDSYRYAHRDRLSQLKPPASLIAETSETCRDSCVLYRHKNKLYAVNLLMSCSDGTSGTWACFRVVQLSFGRIDTTTNWGYTHWPAELGLRLRDVPKDGLDISAGEYRKHREFYTRLLSGSRFMYKDGNYIYQGVSTRYR